MPSGDHLELVAARAPATRSRTSKVTPASGHEGDALVVEAAERARQDVRAVLRLKPDREAAVLVGQGAGIVGVAVADLGAREGQAHLTGADA